MADFVSVGGGQISPGNPRACGVLGCFVVCLGAVPVCCCIWSGLQNSVTCPPLGCFGLEMLTKMLTTGLPVSVLTDPLGPVLRGRHFRAGKMLTIAP